MWSCCDGVSVGKEYLEVTWMFVSRFDEGDSVRGCSEEFNEAVRGERSVSVGVRLAEEMKKLKEILKEFLSTRTYLVVICCL